MSTVFPLIDGWVGYGDRQEFLLRSDEPLATDHPLVLERPELFAVAEPAGGTAEAEPPVPVKKAAAPRKPKGSANG
jgi:hypothetical protein